MYTITIVDSAECAEDMADMLDEISRQLNNGMTSGYHPTWKLEKVETDQDDNGK